MPQCLAPALADPRLFALAAERSSLAAARALAELDGAVAVIRAEGAPLTGALRIAAPQHLGRKVIGPRLPAFMAAHPALAVSRTRRTSPCGSACSARQA